MNYYLPNFPEIVKSLMVGKVAQPSMGKNITAIAPANPLKIWILALLDVEWNSDNNEVTADIGPVYLNEEIC